MYVNFAKLLSQQRKLYCSFTHWTPPPQDRLPAQGVLNPRHPPVSPINSSGKSYDIDGFDPRPSKHEGGSPRHLFGYHGDLGDRK